LGQAFVVVVNGDGEHLLGGVLTDHMLIEKLFDLGGLGNAEGRLVLAGIVF
jgi:ABC-type microcin C transport system permease subunit YejB